MSQEQTTKPGDLTETRLAVVGDEWLAVGKRIQNLTAEIATLKKEQESLGSELLILEAQFPPDWS